MGRPSKYRPEFCALLIEHCDKGLSFESFAAVAEVNRDTIYAWAEKHEEFAEAKSIAEAKSLLFHEKVGIKAMLGKLPGFVAAVWAINMKNRFGYRDNGEENNKQPISVTFNYDPNPVEKK